jgi:toxin YoeB
MRKILFEERAFEEYSDWAIENPSVFKRLRQLIRETKREPFKGLGKPEPLKHQMKGSWSRRITDEHRLVYKVTEEVIYIVSCKSHYE